MDFIKHNKGMPVSTQKKRRNIDIPTIAEQTTKRRLKPSLLFCFIKESTRRAK